MSRYAGVLLHPTSLPGPYGIGDLGPAALQWVDFVAAAGCQLWQVLPLGPTGYGDSPYQTFSTFAGNPYLVSPDLLVDEGLVTDTGHPRFPARRVDYGPVIRWKNHLLDRAYDGFTRDGNVLAHEYEEFSRRHHGWLEDYALFMALKDSQGGRPWTEWPEPLRLRRPEALEQAREEMAEAIDRRRFRQFLFFRQWRAVRTYAHAAGVRIIGDIPIYVAADSSDAWANPEQFHFDPHGLPTVVAGVPPDYFSETGQLWGNPLYRWDTHRATGYAWWIERVRATLELVDIIRVDHFRGFYDYWEIPADATTAVSGRWVLGPGVELFEAIEAHLGPVPILAEDLGGDLHDGVHELRDGLGLPGMKVLQFAFRRGPGHEFLPHNYQHPNWVVYTGTHDNLTSRGYWETVATPAEQEFARAYLGSSGRQFAWDLIRLGWSSTATYALAPMQDLLNLGVEATMNRPSTATGNWQWRMPSDGLRPAVAARLAAMGRTYGRLGDDVTSRTR